MATVPEIVAPSDLDPLARGYRLCGFDPLYAPLIAGWVGTEEQLRWLAPSTPHPLTAAKVVAWKNEGRRAFVFFGGPDSTPLGYGELNPMGNHPDHWWLGHILVRPDQRRRGIGGALVRALLAEAFERRGAARVSLIVFPDNLAAVHCYRRAGFREVGHEHHRFTETGPLQKLLRLEITSPEMQTAEPSPRRGDRVGSVVPRASPTATRRAVGDA